TIRTGLWTVRRTVRIPWNLWGRTVADGLDGRIQPHSALTPTPGIRPPTVATLGSHQRDCQRPADWPATAAAVRIAHHIEKSDAGEGRAARGSTALAGFVDVMLELRRFRPDCRADRRRVLTGYGRFDEVPGELVIELAADGSGYTAE